MEKLMIGLSVEDINRIPTVIAVASGEDKVKAVCAALRGSHMDVLVIDMATAKLVLEWHRSHPIQQ
jgi:DNA-binding transcriptional regulator LsrR (DeoR family)